MPAGVTKALIVGPAWVGDMVMAHTLVQCLTPATIHMVAPPATAPLATRMPEVDRVHTVEFAHGELGLGKRRRAGKALAAEGFDVAYVLPNSWKSALLPWFAGIPRRVGWHGEARYGLLNDRRVLREADYPLMIERFMALASTTGALPGKPYPQPRLRPDAANAKRLAASLGLQAPAVALCPGAEFGAAKKWPPEHYAALARHVLRAGRQVWLLGSPNDRADCAAIAERAPGAIDLAGRTSLLDALDVLSLADQVVCNDSGLMHVAAALGKPTIGIFGSTSPAFTPPLGQHATVVERYEPCRPCFQRNCPLGHLNCLRRIAPQDVIDRLVV